MTKIVSFGDSFIFGSELPSFMDAWPGQIAQELGAKYETWAVPGCGNEHIARQVYTYFANNPVEDTLAVVNWTWGSRWDFYVGSAEQWITLGPTCVPRKLDGILEDAEAERLINFYQDYPGASTLWEKYRALQTMFAVQGYLKHKGIKSIQTYMDSEIFDQTWHAPDYVRELQSLVQPELKTFAGQTFLEWSRSNGFEVTEPGWHPLKPAHTAASKYWLEEYIRMIKIG